MIIAAIEQQTDRLAITEQVRIELREAVSDPVRRPQVYEAMRLAARGGGALEEVLWELLANLLEPADEPRPYLEAAKELLEEERNREAAPVAPVTPQPTPARKGETTGERANRAYRERVG